MPGDYLGGAEELARLARVAGRCVTPVCAVVGGMLSQEVVKSVTRSGEPVNNMLVNDGWSSEGKQFQAPVPPKK